VVGFIIAVDGFIIWGIMVGFIMVGFIMVGLIIWGIIVGFIIVGFIIWGIMVGDMAMVRAAVSVKSNAEVAILESIFLFLNTCRCNVG
jgi:hypothetical protein